MREKKKRTQVQGSMSQRASEKAQKRGGKGKKERAAPPELVCPEKWGRGEKRTAKK